MIYSDAAEQRAEKTGTRAQQKAAEQLKKRWFHLQAQHVASRPEAQAALTKIASTLHYHQVVHESLTYQVRDQTSGRPQKNTPIAGVDWSIQADFQIDPDPLKAFRQQKACFVLGTNAPISSLTDHEVFTAYKKQSSVEHGFRFLKDP